MRVKKYSGANDSAAISMSNPSVNKVLAVAVRRCRIDAFLPLDDPIALQVHRVKGTVRDLADNDTVVVSGENRQFLG